MQRSRRDEIRQISSPSNESEGKNMKRTIRRTYSVHYRMYSADQVKTVCIIASDKWDAYDRARWEVIPEKEGCEPYSAWVDNYTTQAGREVKIKNAFEGNPVGDC